MTRLQYITARSNKHTYLEGATQALKGGCRWIQLRMKEAPVAEIIAVGRELRELCNSYHATFIIDDHVELVPLLQADGVHLGLTDMPVAEARKVLGPDIIIGGTANTIEHIRLHYSGGANYIGCGPYRFTTTKKSLAPTLGQKGYQQILSQMREEQIELPLIAIGGIQLPDIEPLMRLGVSGVAISGTILNATEPVTITQEIIKRLSIYDETKS